MCSIRSRQRLATKQPLSTSRLRIFPEPVLCTEARANLYAVTYFEKLVCRRRIAKASVPISIRPNDPGSGTLSSARFFQAYILKPPSVAPRVTAPSAPEGDSRSRSKDASPPEAGDPSVILNFADGTPAIMERTWGLGRVVQCAGRCLLLASNAAGAARILRP